jgi:outer membrane protein assembly factor BamB
MAAGSALVAGAGYRVLAPAEVVTVTGAAYPAAATARPGVIGKLAAAPLIVEDRIRVYAATRQVRADGPVDAAGQHSPRWSYRRWPARLVGVVAEGSTVVSRWSDGRLVAVDAPSGRVAWRASGPRPVIAGYADRGTGADTVYAPVGLYTAPNVVLVRGFGELAGYDLTTGRRLWRTGFDGRCSSAGFALAGGWFAAVDTCAAPQVLEIYDTAGGQRIGRWRPPGTGSEMVAVPLGCAVGRSGCAGARILSRGTGQGWLIDGAEPVRAPALDAPDTWLAGDVVVDGAGRAGRSVRTGAPLWTWPGRGEVVAVEPGAVHVLSDARELVTLDAATGAELSRFPLTYPREPADLDWRPGHVYARHRFVAVERLSPDAVDGVPDGEYYATDLPVLLAGT